MFNQDDKVIVKRGERILSTNVVKHITPRQFALSGDAHRKFFRKDGFGVDHALYCVKTDDAGVAQAEAEIAAETARLERERKAAAQAAYDALPESVKMAREICFFCDTRTEVSELAEAPLEVLKPLYQWIKERKQV